MSKLTCGLNNTWFDKHELVPSKTHVEIVIVTVLTGGAFEKRSELVGKIKAILKGRISPLFVFLAFCHVMTYPCQMLGPWHWTSQLPKLWANKFLFIKLPSLRYFVTAAQDSQRSQSQLLFNIYEIFTLN